MGISQGYLNQFQYTKEKDTVTLYGSITIGAAGAVGSFQGGGFASVTKEATAGQYTIGLDTKWARFLSFDVKCVKASATTVATAQLFETPASYQADIISGQALTLQLLDFAGAAVNPASGEILLVKLVFRKSSVGPWDA